MKIVDFLFKSRKNNVPKDIDRSSSLLSSMLLIVSIGGLFFSLLYSVIQNVPLFNQNALIFYLAFFLLFITYLINRAGYFKFALNLSLLFLSIGVFTTAIVEDMNLLPYLVIPILLAALFLPLMQVVIWIVINMTALLIIPLFTEALDFYEITAGVFGFISLYSLLIIIFKKHRDNLEEIRTRKVKESEKLLFTTLNSIGDAVITTDEKGKVKFMNPVAEKLTGWSEKNARNKSIKDVFHIINEETRKEVESPTDRVLKEGIVVGLANHTVLISKDGKEFPIDDSGAPIADNHDILGAVLVFKDVTERRRIQAEIQRSEKKLSTLIGNLPGIAYRCLNDEKWTMTFLSERFDEITGYQIEDVIDNNKLSYNDIIHPEDRERIWKEVQKSFEEGNHYELEYRIVTKSGDIHWVWERGLYIHEEEEGKKVLEGFIADITDRKKAEQELQDKLKESEILIKAAVGREQRIKELKDKMKDAKELVDRT